jgi:hypothetical protein
LQTKFYLQESYLNDLKSLPWHLDLENWNSQKIKFLEIRKGISRHPVKFIRINHSSFAIKQTTEFMARIETANYEKLLSIGMHTLIPVGYVVHKRTPFAVETKVGISYLDDEAAFVITLLEDKALPDSHLYKLNFKEKNLKIIWNAAAELLAVLHFNNIYWGDASLANMLVRFFKVRDEKGRVRTQLKAVLADAETVRVLPKISAKMRAEELKFFFESMNWLNEDYKKAGYTRENFSTLRDKKYILDKYKENYSRLGKIARFENVTGINVRKHFQLVDDAGALNSIMKQINEHKWYLSEKAGKETGIKEASENWLKEIYYPIINEFEKLDIFEHFPFKNSVGLYVDIMTHKYYLSQAAGKDVGFEKALNDYVKKFTRDKSFISVIKNTLSIIRKLFY